MAEFRCESLADTERLAQALAAICVPGDCLLLSGDLGVGKSAFARAFIRALCEAPGEIASPTFTLMQTYNARSGTPIVHADLYRLKSAREIVEIGLEEALQQSISLIEWPQIAAEYWPQGAFTVDGYYGEHEQQRLWRIAGDARIDALALGFDT